MNAPAARCKVRRPAAGGGVQGKIEWPFAVHVRCYDDDPAIVDLVGRGRKRTVQIQSAGAARQRKGRCYYE